jgi:hypothetical protein
MPPEISRIVAQLLAALRILNGCALVVMPGRTGSLYMGAGARAPAARAMARFTGVRDIATGTGTIAAVQLRQADVEMVATAAVVEGVDALIGLASMRLAKRFRILALTSIGAAVVGGVCAVGLALDREEERSAGAGTKYGDRSDQEGQASTGS